MFDGFFFFTYIFAAFVGCLAILMVVMMARYWSSGNKKLLVSIRNFMICTALIDALYFYMEYYYLKNSVPLMSSVARILDILLFIGQVYFWAAYIREKGQLKEIRMSRISAILCAICVIFSSVCYMFLMDDYYFAEEGIVRTTAVALEITVAIMLTFITVWHLIKGLSELLQRKIRNLVVAISLLLTGNGVWNALLVIYLMIGKLSAGNERMVDPTPVLILIMNILTIMLAYQEDFSPMFGAGKTDESDPDCRLNFIAESHSLTQREREVMKLAYEGMTNPEIAEELVISKYTVKRHMHNIFEKLDISTRMELVHLINQENGPGGPLKNGSLQE